MAANPTLTQPSPPAPFLEFQHVSISFGSSHVLNDVSFTVLPGERVCILGRSGVGKSVCLRIMMGFLKPDAGRVITAGEDITNYSEEELQRIRKKVTMVFQNGGLFDSLTVEENVAFPLRERENLDEEQICKIVDSLLKTLDLERFRDRLPSDISTGTRRSVAIARALAAKPAAVLYDEPTTMVDPLTARALSNLIARENVKLGLTSVVVTHDMRLAEKLAGRVVFLEQGKVVFLGTTAEMERSSVPLVQQFLQLDRIDFRAVLEVIEPTQRIVG